MSERVEVLIGGVPVAEYVADKWSHLERGDELAPPPDREPDPLDELVASIITAAQASTRIYPDCYAWIIADAIRETITDHPEDTDG